MQCFPKNLFTLIQVLILSYEAIATLSVLDKGVVSLHKNSVGLQLYVDIENKDRINSCAIRSWASDCCLTDGEEDCNSMFVYGGNYFVKPKDRQTLMFIYPSMYQHDQVGNCDFNLDYQCGGRRRSKRQKVNVAFDTRILTDSRQVPTALMEHYLEGESSRSCDTLDHDSLHDCEPVNCDMKYGGERPFYDSFIGKCVEATTCESDPEAELPDFVYVPSINACRDLEHPLTISDIYAISTGTGVVTQPTNSDQMKVELRSNCSTVSQNLNFLRDVMYGKLCPVAVGDMSDYSACCKTAVLAIFTNIASVCALVLFFFCCIQTTIWIHKKFTRGEFKNIREKLKNILKARRKCNETRVNSEVRKTLLREVIVRDLPMELRDSIVNICERMEKKVKKKKRYRGKDIGSQISLNHVECDVRTSTGTSSASSLEESDERQKLLK